MITWLKWMSNDTNDFVTIFFIISFNQMHRPISCRLGSQYQIGPAYMIRHRACYSDTLITLKKWWLSTGKARLIIIANKKNKKLNEFYLIIDYFGFKHQRRRFLFNIGGQCPLLDPCGRTQSLRLDPRHESQKYAKKKWSDELLTTILLSSCRLSRRELQKANLFWSDWERWQWYRQ